MNSDQINQVIQGIGTMTELYMITYQNFRKLSLSDDEAIKHTKTFMSAMMDSVMGNANGGQTNGNQT